MQPDLTGVFLQYRVNNLLKIAFDMYTLRIASTNPLSKGAHLLLHHAL